MPWAAQKAQTEVMFQNVAYRLTEYRTGPCALSCPPNEITDFKTTNPILRSSLFGLFAIASSSKTILVG